MNSRTALSTVAATLVLGTASSAFADATIDTFTGWNGVSGITPWSAGGTEFYGQTFETPDDVNVVIEDFTFWTRQNLNMGGRLVQTDFTASIYEWDIDNNSLAGAVLYTSGVHQTAGTASYEPVTVDGIGVALESNTRYIMVLEALTGVNTDLTTMAWWFEGSGPYDDGSFEFSNNDSVSQLFDPWESVGPGGPGDLAGDPGDDIVFIANFSQVPAPGSAAVLGLCATSLLRRRR